MLDSLFKLREHGTDVRTEALAGLTTFLTMAYVVIVIPRVLGEAGMPVAAVAAATCLVSGLGTLLMGFLSNTPLALAPGMGLSAYFTYTVVKGLGIPWQVALGCVFISGILFFLLTLTGLVQKIVRTIPATLFTAVAGGIGLFIAFIGLKSAGIVVASPATSVALGNLTSPTAVVCLVGLAVIAALSAHNIKGAMVLGIVVTTAVGWSLGLVHMPPNVFSAPGLSGTAFKLELDGVLAFKGGLSGIFLEIIFVFLFVDLFDNLGTLVAVAKKGRLLNPDGAVPRLKQILIADSVASIMGSLAGTSTVTSFIESTAGVAVGGRTGLTSVVVGILFLCTLLLAPLVQAVPTAATAPVLIVIGCLMMEGLGDVEWAKPSVGIPAFLTLITIPLTYSIANGLAFGITSHVGLQLLLGKVRRQEWLLYILASLFIVRFIYLANG